jgi:hypothetical protein
MAFFHGFSTGNLVAAAVAAGGALMAAALLPAQPVADVGEPSAVPSAVLAEPALDAAD